MSVVSRGLGGAGGVVGCWGGWGGVDEGIAIRGMGR